MKIVRKFALAVFVTMSFTSCFKDEAPNTECDITKAWLHVDNPTDMFLQYTDTAVNVMYDKSDIEFRVRRKTDLSALAPEFEITAGATISPANGSVQDFSKGAVIYTVTSEDGNWSRKYAVSFTPVTQIVDDMLDFDFETADLFTQGKATYYKWYETDVDGSKKELWATPNAGFALSKSSAKPEEYPCAPVEGYDGKAVKLTTKSTGAWGEMVKRPIASGTLFFGEFDVSQALVNTLHCTRMGRPFGKLPVKITGMYKYKAGDVYQTFENKKVEMHPEIKDKPAIYAVFYRNHDAQGNKVMIYGEDAKTNPNIVGMAEMTTVSETDEWTPFEIVFNYTADIDLDELESLGYNLNILFTSSHNGDYFEGAVGSTLYIDKVRVITSNEE